MNLKWIFQSIAVLTLSLVFFNNCSQKFDTASGSSTGSSTCAMKEASLQNYDPAFELAAANQNALANPFRTKKIADEVTATSDQDLVVLVSNKCLKGRAANQLSAATKVVRVESGNEDRKMWSYKIKRSDLKLDDSAEVQAIEADPCVIGVGPNRTYTLSSYAATDFNDPLYSQQSTLKKINFFDSLAYFYRTTYGIGSHASVPKTVVAVIDTGVHYDHPDLTSNILQGPNGYGIDARSLGTAATIYNGNDIDTTYSHGTHVAGLIAAVGANALGITGVAPKGVSILPIRGFYIQSGVLTSDTDTIAKAVAYAADQNVDVINLSLGGSGDDPVFKAALTSAIADGVFISVAAGNDGQTISSTFKTYPAFYGVGMAGLMTVGSIDSIPGTLSAFSNRSPTYVEIAGPGNSSGTTGIVSTVGTGNYAYLRGTSQASPHIAGAAALIVALIKENGGTKPTPAALESLMAQGAAKNSALATSIHDGNVLDLKKLGALVNQKYPVTIGKTACP